MVHHIVYQMVTCHVHYVTMAMDGYGWLWLWLSTWSTTKSWDRQLSHGICACKRLQKGTLQRPHFCITLNQSNEISSNNTTKKTDKGMRQKCQNQLYLICLHNILLCLKIKPKKKRPGESLPETDSVSTCPWSRLVGRCQGCPQGTHSKTCKTTLKINQPTSKCWITRSELPDQIRKHPWIWCKHLERSQAMSRCMAYKNEEKPLLGGLHSSIFEATNQTRPSPHSALTLW